MVSGGYARHMNLHIGFENEVASSEHSNLDFDWL